MSGRAWVRAIAREAFERALGAQVACLINAWCLEALRRPSGVAFSKAAARLQRAVGALAAVAGAR